MTWHLYVVRTDNGSLYAGVTTNVRRRYQEHVSGGRKAAKFLRANPPKELVFKRRIGSCSMALKVEYRFKRLPKRDKEAIVSSGRLRFDRESGRISGCYGKHHKGYRDNLNKLVNWESASAGLKQEPL